MSETTRVEAGQWVYIAGWKDPVIAVNRNSITEAIEFTDLTEESEGRIKNNQLIGWPIYVAHVAAPFVHGVIIDPSDGEQRRIMLDARNVDFAPLDADTADYAIHLAGSWVMRECGFKHRRAMKMLRYCPLYVARARMNELAVLKPLLASDAPYMRQ